MIVKIRGILDSLQEDQALIDVGGIVYGVLVSPATGECLAASGLDGKEVTFHTLYYIEGGVGIGNLTPRLVGFLSPADLEFFTLLITVQGLGMRKALRSMVVSASDFARAIELNDLITLKRFPEIGTKTAQKIVMELKGKVSVYAQLRDTDITEIEYPRINVREEYQTETLEVLLQLQYSEKEALDLVERTAMNRPDIKTSDALIQEIFRNQAGKNGSSK